MNNKSFIMKNFVFFVFVFFAFSSCGGDGTPGDFLGSCTEVQLSGSLCVDYYADYTLQEAQNLCSTTGDQFSSGSSCESENSGMEKLSGACKIVDNATTTNGVFYVTYYSGFFSNTSATAHCDSYHSISGYTASWVSAVGE